MAAGRCTETTKAVTTATPMMKWNVENKKKKNIGANEIRSHLFRHDEPPPRKCTYFGEHSRVDDDDAMTTENSK